MKVHGWLLAWFKKCDVFAGARARRRRLAPGHPSLPPIVPRPPRARTGAAGDTALQPYRECALSPDEILALYFELEDAGRWSFDCKDGVHCEGYALETEETRVRFGHGGPLAPEEPEWIEFDSICLSPLDYLSEQDRCWKTFTPPASHG